MMNGHAARSSSSASNYDSRYGTGLHPSSKALLEGYKGSLDSTEEARGDRQRFQHTNGSLMRTSELLDTNDPVSMHLLMETAIGDSSQYGLLSFEEVDELKKDISILSTRIDATKRKLAIENKLRDAATSLNRLYTPNSRESVMDGGSKRQRRSVTSKGSASDLLSKTDSEMATSNKKCEDLAQELLRLERRSQELQKRLLEHTAGVLQMTHKGYLENDAARDQADHMNGYHESPAGLPMLNFGNEFDDRSFYQTLDSFLESGDTQTNGKIASAFAEQTESILETERKLWDLNRRLRDSIAQASASRQMLPAPPAPQRESKLQHDHEVALRGQLEYLEKGLDSMQRSQVDTLQGYKQSAYAAEERLEDLNTQLRGLILRSNLDPDAQYPQPPDISGRSPEEQIAFLGNGLDALEQGVERLKDDSQTSTSKGLVHEEKVGQYETALLNLWQNTFSEEDRFSLQAFSANVQSLHARAKDLHEQKETLGRQIQQQRELNSKSDSEKDAQLAEVTAELEKARNDVESTVRESIEGSNILSAQLAVSKEDKDQLLAELQDKHENISSLEAQLRTAMTEQEEQVGKTKGLEAKLQEKYAETEKARTELEVSEGDMVRLQTELTVARAELDGAYGTRAQRAAEVASHPAMLKEIEGLNKRNGALLEELAGLKTQHEAGTAELNQRVHTLQKELSETIGEYEVMTKSSIEYEKEREHLENLVDTLRDRVEALETQISDGKVESLGVNVPGKPGSQESQGSSNTSTAILKNEFKKMMRETRAENLKVLRVEQDERRKLEAQLRTLKKDQAPGKSLLSRTSTNISSSIIIATVPNKSTSSACTRARMGAASDARSPLEVTTNEARTPTPSPPSGTAKTGPTLRRKSATQALGAYLDSSESYPSPHDSIYEAPFATSQENLNSSPTNDWDNAGWGNSNYLTTTTNDDESPAWLNITMDASGSPVPASFLRSTETVSPIKLTHIPHVLYPITEQSSRATLRPLSVVAQSSAATLRARASGLKRKSFSTSDLPPSPNPTSQRHSPPSSPVLAPIQPPHPPPTRSPTPPGLPSFDKPEASNYRLPPPPARFRDKFCSPTAAEREWLKQTVGLPKGVVMRGEDGVLVRGKFTPIRSGHLPPQRQVHGIYGMPRTASGQGQRMMTGALMDDQPARVVRFENRDRTANHSLRLRNGQIERGAKSKKKTEDGKRKEKWLKNAYWFIFCCGLCEEYESGR
ncbi:MAG: hypothetical protein ASARMPREDX12_005891 [Alectoria sarmentosa]|nr:MAG: hypothetical protein ASARMPREDX12_005891 [Alectoria sarmentosa]